MSYRSPAEKFFFYVYGFGKIAEFTREDPGSLPISGQEVYDGVLVRFLRKYFEGTILGTYNKRATSDGRPTRILGLSEANPLMAGLDLDPSLQRFSHVF